MKQWIGIFGVAVSAALMLGGCGRGRSDDIDGPGKKVRYLALGAKVRGLDPGDIGDTTSSAVGSQCYECLYQYSYLKRPYELEPGLAAAMPEISEDRLTYTIRLRPDVRFVDDPCFPGGKGRLLTAHDFVYAWKRIANVKYLSRNWPFLEDKIVGLDEFRQYTQTVASADQVNYSQPVEGLKAVDDHTLRITLKRPCPYFLYTLAHLPSAPMAREAVGFYGDQIQNVTVGTGAFTLKSWKRGSKIVLVRNPNYREEFYPTEGEPGDDEAGLLEDAGKPLPLVDALVYTIIEEDQPLWLSFMKGKIDSAGIPKDFFNQAITPERKLSPELARKGIELVVQEQPDNYWFGFNMEDPVVGKNRPLRRAMSCAWNRQEYIDVFNNGRGYPAKGIFPRMFKEYDPAMENPWTEFNLDRAREQMKEAEAIHGGPITVTLSLPGTDTTVRQYGGYFQRSMEKIGLNVVLDYMDWPTFQDKVHHKSVQIFSMGWVADFPDAQNFLFLFYGANVSPGPNNFNYRNPEFDELYSRFDTMDPGPERVELARKLERIVVDDVPCIFSAHRVAFVPYYKYVRNYKPHAFGWGAAKYSDLDLELRKELVGR